MIAPAQHPCPAALPPFAPALCTPLLMCSPRLYSVSYVINPWMAGNVGGSSARRAREQWERLYATLSELTEVQLIEPVPGSPDMVFTANAGLARDGVVALSSFLCPERQGEEPHFHKWFVDAGYRVVELSRETPFEGEGDALFSAGGSRLWVGYGTRTAAASHQTLRSVWDVDVVGLQLVDPRFYHLDTCFAPLTDGSLLYYPGAFSPEALQRIEAFYTPEERIPVAEADAVCFACNAVNLGHEMVLNHISPALERTLRDRGFAVTQLPLDEFLKAGGAAKCLVMKLSPERHRSANTVKISGGGA